MLNNDRQKALMKERQSKHEFHSQGEESYFQGLSMR
jgi:hypothetical protein